MTEEEEEEEEESITACHMASKRARKEDASPKQQGFWYHSAARLLICRGKRLCIAVLSSLLRSHYEVGGWEHAELWLLIDYLHRRPLSRAPGND